MDQTHGFTFVSLPEKVDLRIMWCCHPPTYASLMFQLKAIEASFICDAQIAIGNNSIETIDKSVQTVDETVHAIDEFVQMNTASDDKSVTAATSAAAVVAVTPPAVAPATAKRSCVGTKGELRERLKKAN